MQLLWVGGSWQLCFPLQRLPRFLDYEAALSIHPLNHIHLVPLKLSYRLVLFGGSFFFLFVLFSQASLSDAATFRSPLQSNQRQSSDPLVLQLCRTGVSLRPSFRFSLQLLSIGARTLP